MNPVDIAAHIEALNLFMVNAIVRGRLEVRTSDEQTALEYYTRFTDMVTAAESFLGINYDKDIP
jgi:hypothetical protein